MVSVAQGLIPDSNTAFPALVTFHTFLSGGGSSVLGLGDILIPGFFLCFLYRADIIKQSLVRATQKGVSPAELEEAGGGVDKTEAAPLVKKKHFAQIKRKVIEGLKTLGVDDDSLSLTKGYFLPSLCMYLFGLLLTFIVLVLSGSGQPALLYLVPCVLIYPLVQGYRRGELHCLWKGAFEIPEGVNAEDIDITQTFAQQQQKPEDGAPNKIELSRGTITGIESDSDDDDDNGNIASTTTTTTTNTNTAKAPSSSSSSSSTTTATATDAVVEPSKETVKPTSESTTSTAPKFVLTDDDDDDDNDTIEGAM